jgi:hypothetical protein
LKTPGCITPIPERSRNLSGWVRDRELAANPLGEEVADLSMIEERLPRGPFEGSPRVSALCLFCAARSRAGEGAGEVPRASSDYDEFLLGVGRQGTQGFLASVLQDEDNRLAKVREAFFTRFPLTVGSGHFGAICDVPWTVLLDNRRELIVHKSILPPPAESNPPAEAALVRHFGHLTPDAATDAAGSLSGK